MAATILTNNHNIPSNLEDAISILERNTKQEDLETAKSMTEKDFSSQAHFSFGMGLRNNWNLWWSARLATENRDKGYPQTKPAIVDFFNNLGIYHADDMSGIIVTSFYRKVVGLDIDLDAQVQRYIDYWAAQGVNFNDEE